MICVKGGVNIEPEERRTRRRMTPKEFLSQAWEIDARIEQKIEEKERLESRLMSGRMTNLSGMPRGGQYDWTDTAATLLQLTDRINAEIMDLCRIKRQVNDAIDAVEDMRMRRVLELRYRNYHTWEQIAKETGFVYRHVIRLHGDALQQIKVPKMRED